MIKLYMAGVTLPQAGKAYESLLLGQLPPLTVISQGGSIYFTDIPPCTPQGTRYEQAHAIKEIYSTEPAGRTRLAWREFLAFHHLPKQIMLRLMPTGVSILPEEAIAIPQGEPLPLSNPLTEIWTASEIAEHYALPVKKVVAELTNPDSPFSWHEKRLSHKEWLVMRSAVLRVYEQKEVSSPLVNPLLRSFTTLEAATIWNRDSSDVRSAASGAGHRAARMDDNDRRKAGKTWLVNASAMERVFGTRKGDSWQAVQAAFVPSST